MAEWPAFSERQFELAANLELLGPSKAFFAPSTNLEQALGFDVALWPGNAAVWPVLLGLPPLAAPPGAPPPPLAGAGAPLFAVASLFVQYKLPFHLNTAGAAGGTARQAAFGPAGAPFFRVTVPPAQQAAFSAWEAGVTPFGGLCRYAAPRFRSWALMGVNQMTGSVCQNSAWTSPAALGASTVWTFDAGGALHMRHSEPEVLRGETVEELSRSLLDVAVGGDRTVVRRHIEQLADSLKEGEDTGGRAATIRSALASQNPAEELVDAAVNISAIYEAAAAQRAHWALLIRRLNHGRGGGGLQFGGPLGTSDEGS